ncbi:Secreted protein OS=Streptomyces fumanus OX=67302 GN=GCM10018772_41530 PE=4 SV=1 [Streptomyces fumanus]
MSMRRTTKARGGLVALTVVAGLTLGVAGCGGGGDDEKPHASSSASKDRRSGPSTQNGQSDTPLAELRGPDGLLLAITSAERDAGGFVTVSGDMKNDGSKTVNARRN